MAGKAAGRAKSKRALVLVGKSRPKMRKASIRDWSKSKQAAFLTALGETCNVKRAAEIAQVSISNAYKRRRIDAAFRAAWLEAIASAYQRLELVLLDRAFNGTEKVLKRKDGSEERMLEYSNQLGLTLLKMHRDTAIAADPDSEPENIEEIRERLFDKLQRLRKREESKRSAD